MPSIAQVLEEIGANSFKRHSTGLSDLTAIQQKQLNEKAEIVAFLAPAEEEKDDKDNEDQESEDQKEK